MKQLLSAFLLGCFVVMIGWSSGVVHGSDFLSDFANPLLQKGGFGDEKAYDFNIKDDNMFIDNVRALFYPDDTGIAGGQIRRFIRIVAVAIFFALLVWAGFKFILHADNPEEIKKAKMSLLYILLGALVFFLSWWILTSLLDVGSLEGLYDNDAPDNTLLGRTNNLAVIILSFLKAIAFFIAVFFIVRYGFKIVIAVGEEEKIKAAKNGLINVLLALIFIKIIDYLYYIVLNNDFKNQAVDFIVQASKFLTYLIGACFVLALLYAGYTMLTATGDDERTKQATNIVKSVFIVGLLVLLFMLVIHQIFQDVVG